MLDPSSVGRQGQLIPTWTTPARAVQRGLQNHEVKSAAPIGRTAVVDQLGTSTLKQVNDTPAVNLKGDDPTQKGGQSEKLVATATEICVLNEDLFQLANAYFDDAEVEFLEMRDQAHEASRKIGEERYHNIKDLDVNDEKQNAFINANKQLIQENTKLDQAKAKLATFEQSQKMHDLDAYKKQMAELRERGNKLAEYGRSLDPKTQQQDIDINNAAIDKNTANIINLNKKIKILNDEYISLQDAVTNAQDEHADTQTKYEAAREKLPENISQKLKDYDDTKAKIKLDFETYSNNPSDSSREALKATLAEAKKLALASSAPTFDTTQTATNSEFRGRSRKSEPPPTRSAQPSGGMAAVRSPSAPTIMTGAPSIEGSTPVQTENAPRQAAQRDAAQAAADTTTGAAQQSSASTAPAAAAGQNVATPPAEPKTPAEPVAANIAQSAAAAPPPPAPTAAKPPPIPPKPSRAATTETPAPAQMGPKDIHQTIQEQRKELQDLKQKLVELTKPFVLTQAPPPPGGGTGAQAAPRTELPILKAPNPDIPPLIENLENLDKQLSALEQKLKPLPERPETEASSKHPPGPSVGPTAQDRIQQQQAKQAEAKVLLMQAQEARKAATDLITREESARRSGLFGAENAATTREGAKPEKEERQPQPGPAAATAESGDQRQQGQGQQQQRQQQPPAQPAKPGAPEARVGQKAFAEGFTGTIETHQWGSTAHLIKTIGGKEFHVTLDFYDAVDENKVNEFLRERSSMEKIDRMMKEYKVFSDLGKKDFVLESSYSGGSQMRYTGKGNVSKTADLSAPEGFLKGKLDKYENQIARASSDPARLAKLEAKKVKVTNVLKNYEIIVLKKPGQPVVTLLGQGAGAPEATAQTAETKKPPTIPPKPLRSLASYEADFKSKLNREPAFKAHLQSILQQKEITLPEDKINEYSLIIMQLMYATSTSERQEIQNKLRDTPDNLLNALMEAAEKIGKDVSDLLVNRLKDIRLSPAQLEQLENSPTLNEHFQGMPEKLWPMINFARQQYSTSATAAELEKKLRSFDNMHESIILKTLSAFEEDALRLTASKPAAPIKPSGPLPERPSELSQAYKIRSNAYEKMKMDVEGQVTSAKKEMENEKEFALRIDKLNVFTGKDPEKIRQFKDLLARYLNTPSERGNITPSEFDKIIPNAFERIRIPYIQDFLKAEQTYQQHLAELNRTTEILQQFDWMQKELSDAEKFSKGSQEAKNELVALKTYLTNKNNEYNAINQQIMSQGSPTTEQQGQLDALRSKQLDALRAFNNLQTARDDNSAKAISDNRNEFLNRIEQNPLRNAS